MSKRISQLLFAAPVLLAGCNSTPFIQQAEPAALETAQRRGVFELNCPSATASILSQENVQPVSFYFGEERAEYTIGVSGCGKRATYVVICPDNGSESCFAGGSRLEQQ